MLKSLLLTLSVLAIAVSAFSQVNDNCADATIITVGSSCLFTTYSSVGATAEGTDVAENPGCGFYQGGDVWFKAVMPTSGAFRVEVTGNSYTPQFALYSGSCGAFTKILCSQLNSDKTISRSDLASQDIYLRVWGYNTSNGGSFNVCIWEPDIPSNDNCADAIAIPMGSSCTFTSGTNAYATAESTDVAPNPTCGFYKGGDVWYTSTIPASGNFRIELNGAGSTPQSALYTGSCGNFTQILCNQLNGEKTVSDPSLANTPIYIRVFNYNSEEGGGYNLCLWEPPIPAHDNCEDAIPIVVGVSCSNTSGTNAYATAESTDVAPNPTCGFYQGGDVWYTSTIPVSGNLRIELTGVSNTPQSAIYIGSCGGFTEILCNQLNAEKTFSDASLGGEPIYIRVFNYNSEEGGEFNLCLWEPPVPANDNCINATPLSITEDCQLVTYTNAYATSETDIAPSPGCGFYQGGDVWFSATVPPTGNLYLKNVNVDANTYFSVYSGTCGDFTLLQCHGSEIFIEDMSLSEQVVYIRMHTYNSEEGGAFEICTYDPTCIGIAAYDESHEICDNETFSFGDSELTDPGLYQYVYRAVNGCDSTVNLTLTVRPTYSVDSPVTICEGDEYVNPIGAVTIGIPTIEPIIDEYLFTSQFGCDSLVTVILTVNPIYSVEYPAAICSGDDYTFPDGTIQSSITSPLSQESLLQSQFGCDSLVTTVVTVNPVYSIEESASICSGDNFTFPDGSVLTGISSSITQESLLQSQFNCDSLVTTILTVNPVYNLDINASICSGENFTFPDGTILSEITESLSQESLLLSQFGCDSLVTTQLTVNSNYAMQEDISICFGDDYIFPDGTEQLNISEARTYQSLLQSIAGCDSTVTTIISINTVNTDVLKTDNQLVAQAAAASFQWINCGNNEEPLIGETNAEFTPAESGSYAVQVMDDNNCEAISACIDVVIVGLNDLLKTEFSIYPNPVSSVLLVDIPNHWIGGTIEVIDQRGNTIYRTVVSPNGESRLNVQDWPKGIYIMQLIKGQSTAQQRMIVH